MSSERLNWLVRPIASALFITVLGFGLSYFHSENQRERLELETVIDERREAVSTILNSMMERRERAVLLVSALRKQNSNSGDLQRRKAKYDDAYVSWNTVRQIESIKIRNLLSHRSEKPDVSTILTFIETGATEHIFKPVDDCIDRAYFSGRNIDYIKTTFAECDVSEKLSSLRDCISSLNTFLYELSSTKIDDRVKKLNIDKEFRESCEYS